MSNAIDSYGFPVWVALTTGDPDEARRFYGGLLNWQEPSAAEATADICRLGGRTVAGICPKTDSPRSFWRIHVSVHDADKAAKAAAAAGGQVVQQPTAINSAGRYAILADHSGAQFAVLEPAGFRGAEVLGEPGALVWSELISDDVEASSAFYGAVFGWELTSPALSDPAQRREWKHHGRAIGGLLPRPPAMPKEIQPYWDVMFAVTDPAAAVDTAVKLGGTNLMPPMETAHGRIAVFLDSVGAVFSVLTPKSGLGH